MFKLVTDPTQASLTQPIRELSLHEQADRLKITANNQPQSRDLLFERHDRGRNYVAKSMLEDFSLRIDDLSRDDFQTLRKMKDDGLPVYLAPNFDKYTRFWAPLNRSVSALVADLDAMNMEKVFQGSGMGFSRSEPAYELGDNGVFVEKAVNVPIFQNSCFGKGLSIGYYQINLATPGHPRNGALLWAANSGSPTLSWYTGERSSKPDEGGVCLVMREAGLGAFSFKFEFNTADATTTSQVYAAVFRLKGAGRVTSISIGFGAQVVTDSTVVDLDKEDEHEFRIRIAKTDANVTLQLIVNVEDASFERRVLAGPIYVYKQSTTGVQGYRTFFTETSPAVDICCYGSIPFPESDFTAIIAGLWPRLNAESALFRLGDTNLKVRWSTIPADTGWIRADLGGITLDVSGALLSEGERFVCGVRYKPRSSSSGDTERGLSVFLWGEGMGDPQYSFAQTADPAVDALTYSSFCIGELSSPPTSHGIRIYQQHVRIDGRAWSNDELNFHLRMMTQPEFQAVVEQTQGRKYLITDIRPSQRPGRWDRIVVDVDFEEVEADPDFLLTV